MNIMRKIAEIVDSSTPLAPPMVELPPMHSLRVKLIPMNLFNSNVVNSLTKLDGKGIQTKPKVDVQRWTPSDE